MQNPQHNMAQTKKLFEEVYNKGNLSACHEYVNDHVKFYDPADTHHKDGLAAFKENEKLYKQAFPNKKIKIEDIFATEDKVVVRWNCQATHQGELQGITATNRKVNIGGISIYRFVNGKINDVWQYWDRLGLLEQIGEIQPAQALH